MSSVSTFESTRWRFTKAEITILSGADIVAAYAIWTFVTYLTDVWDLSVTQAAGIFNLYYGIIKIMPLFTQYIVDAFLGNYRMLMISSYAFVAVSFFHSSSIPLWYWPNTSGIYIY
ncbi:protein NRT1/ PTR FAMILY 5.5 [Prunus yedoensis var. nudiflora]|uniref:Protein NRT1/ PTR FAMILY 5.5 n=1 Tax=Prunus yedoensis var. nudiflora TaxID=2094558 RepID=A0A314YXD6_PRUYE|nr:protein NRT1/ PTR FAMILY 5.5 [Prunus yedoensis var. nudiflora]PQQ12855.1 protein NRT1/ PTR FAMILY 5.5 [Prunus yedoensis var. nudiflora]